MDKISTLGGISQAQTASSEAGVNKANELKARTFKSEKDVEKASGGFEALLLHQMMSEMWSSVDKNGFLGDDSNQASIYRDMFHQAVADTVAEGKGIGVKDFLKKELGKYTKKDSA